MSRRSYPSRPIVGIGGVIIHADRVVLIRRRYEPLAGCWSLPGGTLEVGETLEEGVARELREETGLVVHVGPRVDVFDRILRDADGRVRYHFVLVDFLCTRVGGTLEAGGDVSDVALVPFHELAAFDLSVKVIEVISRARELLTASGRTRSPELDSEAGPWA